MIAKIVEENIDVRLNKPLGDRESYAFCASGNQDRQLLAPFVAIARIVRIEREDAVWTIVHSRFQLPAMQWVRQALTRWCMGL